ncbi:ZPR1 zinc finger domain-containing protein [Candidatus Woesearchaeota archaeon]|nr:ZPR1 zinc finger domain-containing protein [Candidatus Woesearchaeota archaeon]
MEKIEHETCPACHNKTLTLTQEETDIPYFGKTYIFSMSCSNCDYHKADIEAEEQKNPVKITFNVENKKDLNIRVVRSSEASIKIPHVGSMDPGEAAEGFVTNIEGLIERFKKQIEVLRDTAEEDEDRKKAKNLLKKLQRVIWGDEQLKIIIEDPSGNSAIISDKAVVEKLKSR